MRRRLEGWVMPDFSLQLSDDQLQIQSWVHDFAADVIRPAAEEWDEREEFPWPIVEEAAKIGLYGFDFIAQGMLGDPTGLTLPVAIEEMFWGDAGIGLAIMGSTLAAAGIAGNGTPEQVVEWAPQCYGTPEKIALGAFCVSEPDAGSDVSSLRTRAVYDEAKDEWVLNGTKAWITNGGIADVHVVVAAVEPELKSRGQASFIVPPGTPGLSMGQKYKKHGIRASHTSEVVLDDCRVPGSCLLGGKDKLDEKIARAREALANPGKAVGSGKQPAMATFEATRPSVAAQAVGVARAAYEYSLDYAKDRTAFGKAIIENQSIAFMLANMAMEIDAARLLVWRAAWLANNGGYTNAEGSMSKLYAGRTAVWVTERAIQILGGYGYTREYPVERWHRDSKIYDIFEGTEQIQELVISRAISGLRIE
jgi:alkylation response protein AidB-like acyl-CoA dehydrogenase